MRAAAREVDHGLNQQPQPVEPEPDREEMLTSMAALFEPSAVIELRSFARGRKSVDTGYFAGSHRGDMTDAAARLNRGGACVYMTLNRIDPHLLSRCWNRVQAGAPDAATDTNVIRRRWLLLDIDPPRPTNPAATDVQVEGTSSHPVLSMGAAR